MMRAAIAQSTGDIVVLMMDDESFDAADIDKVLAYCLIGLRNSEQIFRLFQPFAVSQIQPPARCPFVVQ
jgi:hypothetical protein